MKTKLRREDVYRIICYVIFGAVASAFIVVWHNRAMETFKRQEKVIALYEQHVAVLQAADNCLPAPRPTTGEGYY